MKIKQGFVLHIIAGENIVVPIGERTQEFHGMIRLNSSGAFLWEHMQTEFTKADLVEALLKKYDVTKDAAADTVESFLKPLSDNGIITEND